MKVYLEHDFQRNGYRVWFYDDSRRRVLASPIAAETEAFPRFDEWHEVEPNAQADPSLLLPADALEALVEAASDHLPPSAATDRHLYDAIGVRDRLLALVEKRK